MLAVALLAAASVAAAAQPASARSARASQPGAAQSRPAERSAAQAARSGASAAHRRATRKHAARKRAARTRARRAALRRIRWRTRTSGARTEPGALGGSLGPALPGGPAPGSGGEPQPGSPPGLPPVFHALSVQSREWSLKLSRTLLTPGLQTIQLNNRGEDPHNLVISPEGTHTPLAEFPETGPDAGHTEQLPLPAGSYYLWCSLPEHEGNGMHATLRVE